jgi:hypothetical protein
LLLEKRSPDKSDHLQNRRLFGIVRSNNSIDLISQLTDFVRGQLQPDTKELILVKDIISLVFDSATKACTPIYEVRVVRVRSSRLGVQMRNS